MLSPLSFQQPFRHRSFARTEGETAPSSEFCDRRACKNAWFGSLRTTLLVGKGSSRTLIVSSREVCIPIRFQWKA